MSADASILGLGWQNFKNNGCFRNFRVPQIHTIIQISQVYYPFCHNLWWKFSGKIFKLRKKNKQTQFSQLFYFLMHFSFLPWWCTLKTEALVRFCKKMLAGFPTWEIQLLLSVESVGFEKKSPCPFWFWSKRNSLLRKRWIEVVLLQINTK